MWEACGRIQSFLSTCSTLSMNEYAFIWLRNIQLFHLEYEYKYIWIMIIQLLNLEYEYINIWSINIQLFHLGLSNPDSQSKPASLASLPANSLSYLILS